MIGADFWFKSARFGETGCVARFATRDIFFRLHGLLCQGIRFKAKTSTQKAESQEFQHRKLKLLAFFEFQHRKLNTGSSQSTLSIAQD
jgi:hypothetical protein